MTPVRTEMSNMIIGADQHGVRPVPAHVRVADGVPLITITFELDEGELEKLQNGGHVALTLMTPQMPPVLLAIE
jgi:hypothetical protein